MHIDLEQSFYFFVVNFCYKASHCNTWNSSHFFSNKPPTKLLKLGLVFKIISSVSIGQWNSVCIWKEVFAIHIHRKDQELQGRLGCKNIIIPLNCDWARWIEVNVLISCSHLFCMSVKSKLYLIIDRKIRTSIADTNVQVSFFLQDMSNCRINTFLFGDIQLQNWEPFCLKTFYYIVSALCEMLSLPLKLNPLTEYLLTI